MCNWVVGINLGSSDLEVQSGLICMVGVDRKVHNVIALRVTNYDPFLPELRRPTAIMGTKWRIYQVYMTDD